MDNLFDNKYSYEKYRDLLSEPLEADGNTKYINEQRHFQKCVVITTDNIKLVEKRVIIKNSIDCLFFLYMDPSLRSYDARYWFFIGQIKNNKNKIAYFSYEAGCCGTGFGFCETSSLHLSNDPNLLVTYGLTDKQRDLIAQSKNILQHDKIENDDNN